MLRATMVERDLGLQSQTYTPGLPFTSLESNLSLSCHFCEIGITLITLEDC